MCKSKYLDKKSFLNRKKGYLKMKKRFSQKKNFSTFLNKSKENAFLPTLIFGITSDFVQGELTTGGNVGVELVPRVSYVLMYPCTSHALGQRLGEQSN